MTIPLPIPSEARKFLNAGLGSARFGEMIFNLLNDLSTARQYLALKAATELTITSGAIVPVQSYHTVDTESSASSDALTDMTGALAVDGTMVVLRAENAARTVVITHGIGANKIACPEGLDIELAEAHDYAILIHNGTQWAVLASSTLDTPTELTIASGVIAAILPEHTVDTEGDTASDALTTVTGGAVGQRLMLRPVHADRTIVVTHGIGANLIATPDGRNILLSEVTDYVELAHNGTQWTVVGHSALNTATELTIASGIIAAVLPYHSVDTEGDTAQDDLTTITGGVAGATLMITPANAARTVSLVHGIGANLIATPGGKSIHLAEVTDWALLSSNGTQWTVIGASALNTATELTIATGTIAVTLPLHTVDTEGGTASDDLSTITGGVVAGQQVTLRPDNAARTINVVHGIGANLIATMDGNSFRLAEITDFITLVFDGTQWVMTGGSHLGEDPTELTIATGVIAKTGRVHTVETEASAASDQLTSVTGGINGQTLLLYPADAAHTVVVTHGIGADLIACPDAQDIELAEVTDWVLLAYNGTQWTVIGHSALNTPTELTIATGAIAVTLPAHTVDTEGDAASDALTDITGGVVGQVIHLYPAHADRTVVVTHGIGTDKIATPGGKSILLAEVTDWAELIYNGTQWTVIGSSALNTATELTIATGAITATLPEHSVDTEGDAASDSLTTINGGVAGQWLVLYANNAGRTVVIEDGTGANLIKTPGAQDISLKETLDRVTLVHNGTQWIVVSVSVLDSRMVNVQKLMMPMAAFGTWLEDGDAIYTNGGGLVGGDAVATAVAAAFAVVEDGGVFELLSLSSSGAYTANFQLFPDSPVEAVDRVYIGNAVPFCELGFNMSATVAAYDSTDVIEWEYSQGSSAWASLTISYDNSEGTAHDGTEFGEQDGCMTFVPPADWATDTVNGQVAYWVRAKIAAGKAANMTTVGITSDEPAIVAPGDGWIATLDGNVDAIRIVDGTTGTLHSSRDLKFILMNYTTGAHSGELTFAQDKRTDFWGSLTLAIADGDVLGVLVTQDDGSDEVINPMLELSITASPA